MVKSFRRLVRISRVSGLSAFCLIACATTGLGGGCTVLGDYSEIVPGADADDIGTDVVADSDADVDAEVDADIDADVDADVEMDTSFVEIANPCAADTRACTADVVGSVLCQNGVPTLTLCPFGCNDVVGLCSTVCDRTVAIDVCSADFMNEQTCRDDNSAVTTGTCTSGQSCRGGLCVGTNRCDGDVGFRCGDGDLYLCDENGTFEARVDCGDNACATYYRDSDNDGWGDELQPRGSCGDPGDGWSEQIGDCDDTAADVNPGAPTDAPYDGIDADCAGDSDWDVDGDGFDIIGADDGTPDDNLDCDDTTADVSPDAVELAEDEIDSDCDGFELLAPDGAFTVGSPDAEAGHDDFEVQHDVTLTNHFEIMTHEVTRALWRDVFADLTGGSAVAPSFFENDATSLIAECPTCPVERVNWYEAMLFANRMSTRDGFMPCYELTTASGLAGTGCTADDEIGRKTCSAGESLYRYETIALAGAALSVYECEGYRLPSEAEWEYAARAGGAPDQPRYGAIEGIACYALNSRPDPDGSPLYRQVCDVGTYAPNAFGLYDLIGNVSEWTSDIAFEHAEDPLTDPDFSQFDDPTGSVRGGAFNQIDSSCRTADRTSLSRSTRSFNIGFRLVRTVPPE